MHTLSFVAAGADDKIYPTMKLAALVDALQGEGVETRAILQRLALQPCTLRAPQTRISMRQMLQGLRDLCAAAPDPGFAAQAGLRFRVSTYGLYGFALLSSPDFRRTAQFMVRYHQLATPLVSLRLEERCTEASWVFAPRPHPLVDAFVYRRIVELQCGVITSLQRDYNGAGFKPKRLELLPTEWPDIDLSLVFDCPVRLGCAENRLVFDAAWLDETPQFGNDIVHADIARLCDLELSDMERRTGVAGRVRAALLTGPASLTRVDQVAHRIGLSERSLRRRLADENTCFRRVLDELKRDVALLYLRDTTLSIDEIAQDLGFADAGSFRHAFVRWTGVTPGRFRSSASLVQLADPPLVLDAIA